ncbi:MAG: hypothetical protein QNJ68_20985 [Microcoleaceae cyanobacterium MO_207.B10]|nr:hypothetical protein [Microcoleaceae cyanobacterium MO_207.B10]
MLIPVNSDSPQLLEGLDIWLRLGLISDEQVKQLCQKHLSTPLPQTQLINTKPTLATPKETDLPSTVDKSPRQKSPNLITQLLKSLMAELSLRWLLFLGLFMVVVSSGLLAASQWEKFPPTGQYLVLLAYTLCFWAATIWSKKIGNLRLTSETLQLVTLLLVPVNFWAIDGLGLWVNIGGLLTVALATIILSVITIYFDKKSRNNVTTNWISITALNLLGLSYLQYGWRFLGFPILAVYLGVIGTALATIYYQQNQPTAEIIEVKNKTNYGDPLTGIAIVIYALGILVARAIFIANVEITQLGLALGISGLILLKNNLSHPIKAKLLVQNRIGISLLFIGWLVSVDAQPWQAFIISIISLLLLAENLQKSWRKIDLTAIFIVGFQTMLLVKRLIPVTTQKTLIGTTTEIFNSQNSPETLLSLTWFPYLIFMVWVTDWIYNRQQINLGKFSERICLGFGVFLNILSWQNPLVVFINFLASSITLTIFTYRRQPTRVSLVYLSHVSGLLSIFSGINYLLPDLSLDVWAIILLIIMLGEWGIFSFQTRITTETRIVRPTSSISLLGCFCFSGWHFGLLLAVISYCLWLIKLGIFQANICTTISCNLSAKWGIIWFITPLALTTISARITSFRQIAGRLSIAAVIMLQFLTFWQPETRLIGFGLGTVLMFVNTQYLLTQTAANITVSFLLIFISLFLGEGILGLPAVSGEGWFLTIAIFVVTLWFLYSRIVRLSSQLFQIYYRAIDGWAVVLCGLQLVILTIHSFGIYWEIFNASIVVITSAILTLFAIGYRGSIKKQTENSRITFSLNNFVQSTPTVYSFGWGLELLTVETLGLVNKSVVSLAIANIALGLLTQILGDFLQRKTTINNLPITWQAIPLIYGILGALLRVGIFETWTGLTTLALSFILIGIGRRKTLLKPILYLGIAGISCAAAELLSYQIYSLPIGEKLIAYASLCTTITYSYRLLYPWLLDYFRLTEIEVKNIANIHWAIGSLLLVLLAVNNFETNISLGLTTGIFLTTYAIMQGRNNSNLQQAETWIYLGVIEGYALVIYIINLLSITEFLLSWLGAIATIVSYFIYILPWENWGWNIKPWQRVSLIIPIATVGITNVIFNSTQTWYWYISILITAGFYIFIAKVKRNIRLTYITVGLIDFTLITWLNNLTTSIETLFYVFPLGLSVLYIAQFDPSLKLPENKNTRHNLRLLGIGMICFVALLENKWTGLLPGIISVIAIFAGLGLRTRAYVYVGTVTLLINVFNQLIILNYLYSFVKWIIGLILGIAFIWISASFETRREQINNLLQNWIEELAEWE